MRRFSAIFVKPEALLFRCLIIAIPVFWLSLSCAHELRPAIATLEFAEDGQVALGLSLNLEAAIAGIGGEHEDTSASTAATEYDRLRTLPPVALQAEFDRIKQDFLDQVTIETSEDPVPLRIATVEILAVGDTALPRFSRLGLKGSAPPGIKYLYWHVAPRFGSSVIRLRDAASEQTFMKSRGMSELPPGSRPSKSRPLSPAPAPYDCMQKPPPAAHSVNLSSTFHTGMLRPRRDPPHHRRRLRCSFP